MRIVEGQLNESFGTVWDFYPLVDDTLFNLDLKAHNGTITDKEVRDFSKFLSGHKMDYMRLYHGTFASHDVPTQGLLPTSATRAKSMQSAHGYVYLAYDPRSALDFARMAYAGTPGTLVVYATDILIKRLLPDHDQLFNKRMWSGFDGLGASLAHSLIYGRGARVRGKIDPVQIHIWGRFDKNGNRLE